MNSLYAFRAIALSVCGDFIGVCLLFFIGYLLISWRNERRLGRRVERWSDDATRMKALLEAGSTPTVAEHIIQGNKINAIKACRLETGLGLKEAKDVVERYESALYRYEPWETPQAH